MTTGVVCGIKSKPRLTYGGLVMDPQFIELESQLAALRTQRHPVTAGTGRLTADATAKPPTSPAPSPKHDVPASETLSSLSRDAARSHADASSTSSSPPSSIDSVPATENPDVTSESTATSRQRHSVDVVQKSSSSSSTSSSLSAAAAGGGARRRSVPTVISEERSRFRIVKIDSYVDRGRWHCHNFADPDPLHDVDSPSHDDSGRRAGVVDGEDVDSASPPPAPPQIYYIAPAAGQTDGDPSDLSRKQLYVSTIVYGVHGHPVLDRTLRMTPLQLLRRTSDEQLPAPPPDTPVGDALTPTPRDVDHHQSPDDHVAATEDKLRTSFDYHSGVDDRVGNAASDPESTENEPGNPLSGVDTPAHSSMPPLLMSDASSRRSMTSSRDVSRCQTRSLSLCEQYDDEMCYRDNGFGRPTTCLSQQLSSFDDDHPTTRLLCVAYFNFMIYSCDLYILSLPVVYIQEISFSVPVYTIEREFLPVSRCFS